MSASVTAKGRLALGLYRPFPTPTRPSAPEPSRSRKQDRTGEGACHRDQRLSIAHREAASRRQRRAGDGDLARVRTRGSSPPRTSSGSTDAEATSEKVIEAIETTFAKVQADDAVFAYMAGHGAVVEGEYYFVAHNTNAQDIPSSGVPLKRIKEAFDASPSQRAFLWLDFCHSGGIIPRDLEAEPDDLEVISRALEVVQGQGKLIIAASTPEQKAYELGAHGLFTDALLRGLKGEAANKGEVTVNSLYDYIDRQMGSERQRPMMFGQMTGRVVLMHHA